MLEKHWVIAEQAPAEAQRLFPEWSRVLFQLLWNRGARHQEDVDIFLGPDFARDTHAWTLFHEIDAAVKRIFFALEKGEIITVHGDYDADGVCGSAILLSTLRDLCRSFGFDASKLTSYIPHREKEGYGFSPATAEHLHEHEKTNLIVTVDCGITNAPAIARAAELGMETIVCDHHALSGDPPEGAILLHPLAPGETYPNKRLCGAGVAFKLACALFEEARRRGAAIQEGVEKWLLDLVAIATITDVMPLQGENRVLVAFGLRVLNKSRRPGLLALFEAAGIKPGAMDAHAIGFQIGPRLNAAGRMSHASEALELLLAEDPLEASRLASVLDERNAARKQASERIYQEAKIQLGDPGDRKVLFAVKEGWPAGLVGLVAGKLVSDFDRPVFVVGKTGESYTASGRSVPGFDITAVLTPAAPWLDRFGGHAEACGFSVTGTERFEKAIEEVTQQAEVVLAGERPPSVLSIDAEIDFFETDWDLVEALERLAPFGNGNPVPTFVSRGVRVIGMDTVGANGKHLRLSLQSADGKTVRKAIGFGFGALAKALHLGKTIDVAYEFQVNTWNGNREQQLRVVDIR
ncbi:MAG TPA: single-stranded-DNA-specific exonuclease RecJ [Patescibacteria group bacterium]|nr:single-stranded-DNA-specific exonuclease RecJ [Patescibacteria group bacterium]